MKHIPNTELKEKKLNINSKSTNLDDIDLTKITKEQKAKRDEAIIIYSEIMEVFKKHNTSILDAYQILASILESIYTYSLLEEFNMNEKKQ